MKGSIFVIYCLIISLIISGCGPGQLFGPTLTPTPTITPTLTATNTPTQTLTSTPTETPIPNTATPALPGRIEGKIVGSNGQPLKDVKLELMSDNKVIAETKSDSRGQYSFENVAPGAYLIAYTVDIGSGITMHMFNDQFVVESDQTVQQDFVFPY